MLFLSTADTIELHRVWGRVVEATARTWHVASSESQSQEGRGTWLYVASSLIFVKFFECRESIRTTFNMFWVHWHHDFGLLCIFAKKSLSRKFWSFCNFGSVLTFFVESLELFLDAGTFITTTTAPTHPWVTRASNITRSGRLGKRFCPTFKWRVGIVKNYFVRWDKNIFCLEYI